MLPDADRKKDSWKSALPFLMVIVLVTAAIRAPLLDIPFERDEGEYAYIGWRLAHHELPYRDWVDQKPPAVFWVYRLALSLPLDPVRAVHWVALLCAAASGIAFFFLARHFLDRFWTAVASVLFALLSADPVVQGTAANTELFMLFPLLLSQITFLSAVSEPRRRVAWMFLAGVFTGGAAAFKQVAGVNWFFLTAAYPLLAGGNHLLRRTLGFAAWSAAGAAAVWAPLAAYFWMHHGLPQFVYHVFTHNLDYVGGLSGTARWGFLKEAVYAISSSELLIWCFATAGFFVLWRKGPLKGFLFLSGWLVASLIGVGASGYFFPHYFQQILPVLALFAVLGVQALDAAAFLQFVSPALRRTLLVLLLAVLPLGVLRPFLFTYTPREAAAKIYPGEPFAEMPEIGKRIAELTRPEDRVFIFGAEPELLFYARRVSATRYIFLFPLYGPYRDARARQMATAAEVTQAAPAAALFLPSSFFFLPGTDPYFTEWTKTYLRQNFRPDRWLTMDNAGKIQSVAATNENDPLSGTVGTLLFRKEQAGPR